MNSKKKLKKLLDIMRVKNSDGSWRSSAKDLSERSGRKITSIYSSRTRKNSSIDEAQALKEIKELLIKWAEKEGSEP